MAIIELKMAASLIENHLTDRQETIKFIQCCEVISLCYSGLANYDEAEKWLLKGIELTKEKEIEYKALRYDLGQLYETTGRLEQATEAYFDVYALDIKFRRVAQKIQALQSRYIKKTRDERIDQLIPVVIRGRTIVGERFEEETLIVNVSRRGAGLRSTQQLQPDTFLELHFENPHRIKIAKVVWCKPITNPVSCYQVGVLVYHETPKEQVT
jgi:tetratricopeptide (TPR) repeat protein